MYPVSIKKAVVRRRYPPHEEATFIWVEGQDRSVDGQSIMQVLEVMLDGPDPLEAPIEAQRATVAVEDREYYLRQHQRAFEAEWSGQSWHKTVAAKNWVRFVEAVGARVVSALTEDDLKHVLPGLADRTIPAPRPRPVGGFPIQIARGIHTEWQEDTDTVLEPRKNISFQLESAPRPGPDGNIIQPAVILRVEGPDPEADHVQVETFSMRAPEWRSNHRSRQGGVLWSKWKSGEFEVDTVIDEAELLEFLGARIFGELGDAYVHLIPGAVPGPKIVPPRRPRYEWTGRPKPAENAQSMPQAHAKPDRKASKTVAAPQEAAAQQEPDEDVPNPLYGRF